MVLEELALLLPLLVLFTIDDDEVDDAGTEEDTDFEEDEEATGVSRGGGGGGGGRGSGGNLPLGGPQNEFSEYISPIRSVTLDTGCLDCGITGGFTVEGEIICELLIVKLEVFTPIGIGVLG